MFDVNRRSFSEIGGPGTHARPFGKAQFVASSPSSPRPPSVLHARPSLSSNLLTRPRGGVDMHGMDASNPSGHTMAWQFQPSYAGFSSIASQRRDHARQQPLCAKVIANPTIEMAQARATLPDTPAGLALDWSAARVVEQQRGKLVNFASR